jgi:hypothetical protein
LFFYYLKLQGISQKKQVEKVRKNVFDGYKNIFSKHFFSQPFFFINDYFGSEYFLSKFKPFSNRPSYTKACCQKSWGLWGDFFAVLSLQSVNSVFSQNHCAEIITNTICVLQHYSMVPPLPQSWQANGQTSAGRSSFIFNHIPGQLGHM